MSITNAHRLRAPLAPLSHALGHRNSQLGSTHRLHGRAIAWAVPPLGAHAEFPGGRWGTHMSDVVRYALPFGLLGRMARARVVKADLEEIFDYRAEKVSTLLGNACSHA